MKPVNDQSLPNTTQELQAKAKKRHPYLGSLGALIGGILTSLCCIVPLLLIILGVGGGWLADFSIFVPYRPYFIIFALGSLSVGFYLVYKKPKEVCKPGSLCAIPQVKRKEKIILWLSAIFVLAVIIIPYLIPYLVK